MMLVSSASLIPRLERAGVVRSGRIDRRPTGCNNDLLLLGNQLKQ